MVRDLRAPTLSVYSCVRVPCCLPRYPQAKSFQWISQRAKAFRLEGKDFYEAFLRCVVSERVVEMACELALAMTMSPHALRC